MSRPRSSRVSSRATPAAPSPRTRWSMNAVDDLGVGQTEQVADVRLLDPLRRGRQELVEHRLGVAHPAGGQPGDQMDRRPDRPARPSAARMRAELALDLGDGQAPDVEALEARQDRRREDRRLGRGEHEDDEVGRLLDRLEERIPGVLRDLVRLVEDVDLALRSWPGGYGSRSRRSRTASMPRLLAASISIRSSVVPSRIETHDGQRVAGVAVLEVRCS